MKYFYFLLLFSTFSFSQNLTISNQKSIGGNGEDVLPFTIKSPTNDGYFMIGNSTSGISGDKTDTNRGFSDIWLVKTDLDFNVLWDKTYGGDGIEQSYGSIIENNKIYIFATSTSSISGEKTTQIFGAPEFADLWFLCLDLTGNIIWQKGYGGSLNDSQGGMTAYSDSSFLIHCISNSGINGNKTTANIGGDDYWLLEVRKTDGEILKQKSIGTTNYEVANLSCSKSAYNNHTYAVGGASEGISGTKTELGYGLNDIWVIEFDENLNIVQDKCFGGAQNECEIYGITSILIHGQDIFIGGSSSSGVSGNKTSGNFGILGSEDIWLLKLDHSLNKLWEKTYGGIGNERGKIMGKNQNGNLIITSLSDSPISGVKTSPKFGSFSDHDAWILILDPNGEILGQNSFGGNNEESGFSTFENPYDATQLILSVYSQSNISGNKTVPSKGGFDNWFAKINAANFLNVEQLKNTTSTLSVYPNPFQNQINFDFTDLNEEVIIRIYSLDGKTVYETTLPKGSSSFIWESEQTAQIFLYEIKGETISHTGRVVKL